MSYSAGDLRAANIHSTQSRMRTGVFSKNNIFNLQHYCVLVTSFENLMIMFLAGHVPNTSTRGKGQQAAFLPSKEVKAEARPATGAGGLARFKTQGNISGQTGRNGRQVQDTSYFVGLVSNKINAITTEISKLRTESGKIITESKHDKKMERKVTDLATEVQILEESLADHNLAADKERSRVTIGEIEQQWKILEEKNNHSADETDRAFLEKEHRHHEVTRIENEIDGMYRLIEERIRKRAAPEKLKEYLELLETRRNYQDEVQRKMEGVNELRQQLQQSQSKLKSNIYRIQHTQEESKIEHLVKTLQQVREQIEISKMGPVAAHEKILTKVKNVQAQTKEFDKRGDALKLELNRLRGEKQRLLIELNELEITSHSFESKNQRLLEKDKEMTEVLNTFESEETNFLEKQVTLQSNISALLEFISHGIKISAEELPSKERLEEVKSEVTFKTKQLETSQQTTRRLQDQKMKRIQEVRFVL